MTCVSLKQLQIIAPVRAEHQTARQFWLRMLPLVNLRAFPRFQSNRIERSSVQKVIKKAI